MSIAGKKNTVEISDILLGDVWLCGGQSNMQWGLEKTARAKRDIPAATHPKIRLVTLTGHAQTPAADIKWKGTQTDWQLCSPATVKLFSAVGYYFGLDLHKKLNVPIGLIMTAEGSTPLMPWISAQSQQSNPHFKPILELYETYPARSAAYRIKRKAYDEGLKKSKAEGTPAPKFPGHFEGYFFESPGWMYNARIAPLAPFSIKGVIWYQGENEAIYKRTDSYKYFFPALIEDWRGLWGREDLPFLYVQLAANAGKSKGVPEESHWAEVRDGQRRTLKLDHTAMVVITDICSSALHPPEKIAVGERLAGAAEVIAYGKKKIYTGPLLKAVQFENGKAKVSFTHTGTGLKVQGEALKGFELAGENRKFYLAGAEVVDGNHVLVHSDKVQAPKFVRYSWANHALGNLFNKENFPTSCFETD
ncbi:MAG: sialate O-acetylesterase [Verrucomicrobiota bacterium]